MDTREDLGQIAEDILNSVAVIYGFFKLLAVGRPDYETIVDEEVKKIVLMLRENILSKR